ncbi:uncharacterized protein LOC128226247 [Mya arenaria]|uniref:uncharacterized protein LOC128226247 n=1 Tax=Mya arenaria TaxID=6604 RepID=UPI0022E38036|nr:uncharacterized protein LOC128226247 [Mya arenaria]
MYQAHTLGNASARALIHSMWYTCTTFFGMRTGAEIRNMRWGDVHLALDPGTGREFIELKTERQTKTRTGENARNVRQNQPRAYATEGEPSRDPVHLFKVYRDRRPDESLDPESLFLLSICTGQQKGWFRNCAMGINSIYSIMNNMKADAGIEDQRITPCSKKLH